MRKLDNTAHLREWAIVAENPKPDQLAYFESVMTLGNGLLGIRGSREESVGQGVSRPMTLMAEVYDQPKCPAGMSARYRSPSRLAPMPNPLFIDFDDGSGPMSANERGILSETRKLDMKRGVLERVVRYKGKGGRITRIVSRRLVSQARPHVAAIRYSITPENYSGAVTLTSMLERTVTYPDGVEQIRERARGRAGGSVWMVVQTRQSRLQVAEAARHILSGTGARSLGTAAVNDRKKTGIALTFNAAQRRTTTLEKVVAIHNSIRAKNALSVARAEAARVPSFARLEREHAAAWAEYWCDSDVEIKGDRVAQTMARFWVFQLLQAASKNNVALGLSASIPAKTLSGWGYGGRIFWDTEIYMLPFFSQQYPKIARSLLMYRHDRMSAARKTAAAEGCEGIKYPWESTDTGREECPKYCPLHDGTDRWERWRGGEQQIHVNSDVALGFWQDYLATGDRKFLAGPGLDILVGTARYWASRVAKRKSGGEVRYEIRTVIGPDESHQSVHNNVYTNAMARWNLRQAAGLVESPDLAAARRRLGVKGEEVERWRFIADRIKINFDPKTGLYEQFDGYFKHPDQTVKQADTLLALYLLPELRPGNVFRKNFKRYYPVTEHGSSLSPCMHVLFSLELGDMKKACEYQKLSCSIDGIYRPGGSDKGLHAAALGGGWSAIVAGFGGVRVTSDCLDVAPRIPPGWKRLTFSIRYRGLRLRFVLAPRRLDIQADAKGPAVRLRVLGEPRFIKPGQRIKLKLK